MKITSPAFTYGNPIPVVYTCDGDNINPPLLFSDIPPGTVSMALVMDDPDAPGGVYVHWLLWNINYDTAEIAEGAVLPGMNEGTNSSGSLGYTGPCPPSGTHRYFFRLYALNTNLNVTHGSTREELDKAMTDHIIAEAELMGVYPG